MLPRLRRRRAAGEDEVVPCARHPRRDERPGDRPRIRAGTADNAANLQGNEGGIARAEAEWKRAERGRVTVRDRIIMDVRLAHERFAQSRAEMDFLESKVIPEVETAIGRADLAYREGDAPYIVALQTTRQLIDARFRREQLAADLHRAWADLERSVGRRLTGVGSQLRNEPLHSENLLPQLTPDPFPPANEPPAVPAENVP